MILNSYRSWIYLNISLDRWWIWSVSCICSHRDVASEERKGYRHTSSAHPFLRFFFQTLYLYISEGMYFGPMEVAATTRWRRAFNLELMNESSRDWTAMSWVISGTSPWRMMHLVSLMCFHLAILSILFPLTSRMSFSFSNMRSVSYCWYTENNN